MNIILISNKSARTRSLTLTSKHLVLMLIIFFSMSVMLALGLNFFSQRYADKLDTPILRALLVSPQEERHKKIEAYLHKDLNVMAVKLGQIQAKMLRLDALGKRLAESSGIKMQFDEIPGQGGLESNSSAKTIAFDEFGQRLDKLSYAINERVDKLGALDIFLRQDRLTKRVLPSDMPIDAGWYSSGYGYRIDPFNGRRVFHAGVDFSATVGTPIKAAAGGIVVYSARHREYGNMVEIDHGDDLISRYAHASKRLVNLGQVVLRGQKIAEVGSTGRSTGPHLHFEIRHKGVPQNPSRFLKKPG